MHPEDRLAAVPVGRLHGDAPVEAARTQQRLVEDVRTVRRRDHDHAGRGVEAVHLGEDLVQRLLALVVAAAEARDARRARAADRVELVDEDDRRRGLLGLGEQIAHTRRTDTDDRLDELRRRHREERHVRLAGDGAGEQRLAGAGRPREQHPVRNTRAEPAVLLGVAQEVDDLAELLLRLVDAGDVGEGHTIAGRLVATRPRAAELAEDVLHPAGAARRIDDQPDQQDRRSEPDEQGLPPRRAGLERLGVDDDLLPLQELRERVRVGEGRDLGLEAVGRLRSVVALRSRERALHGRALRRDRRDVPVPHLLQEVRAVGDTDARRRLRGARAQPVVEDEQPDDPDEPPADANPRPGRPRRLRLARSGVRVRRPAWLRGGNAHAGFALDSTRVRALVDDRSPA